ncbi:hypothetical protein [Amycolatopsis jejuensis]|uniref:hypothetical protein n=1 Tax=Amycolatopsis jejuensis TaxID=330084 RepID=UPI000A620EDF|nr:hypothetical protein [Amycolatopsis jejuensis]
MSGVATQVGRLRGPKVLAGEELQVGGLHGSKVMAGAESQVDRRPPRLEGRG